MCGQVQPCGGDLTGTWSFTNTCLTSKGITDGEAASCAGVTFTVTALSASGTLTFNADMTYTATSLMNGGTLDYNVPASCASSCSGLAANLQAGSGVQSATCSGSSDCSCTVVKAETFSETGTYTTSGSTFSLTPTGGGASRITGSIGAASPYCVQGTTLHAIAAPTVTATGQAAIDQDTIGIKQ
jgi:hypothetical protein